MTVFVISKHGERLMPTSRLGKVRHMLKDGRAVIYKRNPFTIQLTYETTAYTQPVELCEDTGYLHIGVSVKSGSQEYISEQYDLLEDETKRHDDCRKYRRTRRNRKRYRAPRFSNRRKKKGWLAPSIRNKADRHLDILRKYVSVCPVTRIVLEVGQFDTVVLAAVEKGQPIPSGLDYQYGPRYGISTLREAVFQRDHHACLFCGRSSFKNGAILHMHHFLFWLGIRRNKLDELGTVCELCHIPPNHELGGLLYGKKPKDYIKGHPEAAFMNAVKWQLYETAKEEFSSYAEVKMTYGAATKDAHIDLGLEKSHANDAYAMGKFHPARRAEFKQYQKRRRNNRILSKFYDAKYIDSRDGSKKSGAELFNGRINRNHKKDSENLHKYRQKKVSKGRTPVRKRRYPYQPGDLILYRGRVLRTTGAQHYGEYLSIKGQKAVKAKEASIFKYAGGWVPAAI